MSKETENEIIYGERIYLRKMIEDDASFIVEWRNDPEIKKWMFNQEELTIEKHLEWYKKQNASKRIDYIICDTKNNQCIGTVNFINIKGSQAEAGKMLGNKNYWGGGYAKEAFRLWLNHGFDDLGFKKISVRTMINNNPNIKLNEKLGFKTKEKTIINQSGKAYPVLIMEIEKKDLK